MIAKYPFYTKTTVPAGTYAGFDEDVPTISVMAMLVASDKVDDKMGYDIAKAIFSNLDRLQARILSASSSPKRVPRKACLSI